MLFTGPFGVLLAVNVGLGLFFGSTQPAVTGFAVQRGVADLGGVLYSVMSAASPDRRDCLRCQAMVTAAGTTPDPDRGWAVDTSGGMAAFGCTIVFVGVMAITVVVGAQLFTSRSVRA